MAVFFGDCTVSRAAFDRMSACDKYLFVKLAEERCAERGGGLSFDLMTHGIDRAELMRARGFAGVVPAMGLREGDLYA